MSPELKFMLAACVWPATPSDRERIRELGGEVTNVDLFFELLKRHRVTPLVFHNVLYARPVLPEGAFTRLTLRSRRVRETNARQIDELLRLSEKFGKQGVRTIVLKGAPLSVQLYGSPFLRENNDIDFLVEPGRIDEAQAILFREGYERVDPIGPLADHEERIYRHYFYHALYRHPGSGVIVELHWRLVMEESLLPCDVAELMGRAREVVIRGVSLNVLPDPETLLFLCAHGAGHAWWRLKWLIDVDRYLQVQPPAAMEEARSLARRNGLAVCLDASLRLASSLFEDWNGGKSSAKEAGGRERLSTLVLARLLAARGLQNRMVPAGLSYLGTLAYEFLLLGSSRTLGRAFVRLWLYPADWQFIRLPPPLFALHFFLRPVSWLARKTIAPLVGARHRFSNRPGNG